MVDMWRVLFSTLLPSLLLTGEPAEAQNRPPGFAYAITAVDGKPRPLDVVALERLLGAIPPPALLDTEASTLSFVVDERGWGDPSTLYLSAYPDRSGFEALRSEVQRLRFHPATRKGQPVRVLVALRIPWAERREDVPRKGVVPEVGPDSAVPPYRPADFDAFEVTDVHILPEMVNRRETRSLMERLSPSAGEMGAVGGAVTAQFIVLPDGRVDARTITILRADQDELVSPTVEVVSRLRFRPAMRSGEQARVLLAMPIPWTPTPASTRRGWRTDSSKFKVQSSK